MGLWLTWRVPWERMFAPNLRGFCEQLELPGGGLGPGDTESQGGLPHVRALAGQLGPSSLPLGLSHLAGPTGRRL